MKQEHAYTTGQHTWVLQKVEQGHAIDLTSWKWISCWEERIESLLARENALGMLSTQPTPAADYYNLPTEWANFLLTHMDVMIPQTPAPVNLNIREIAEMARYLIKVKGE